MGWLDKPVFDPDVPRYNLQGKAVSRRAVMEGAVLLENRAGTLPLREGEIKRLALIGPNAALTQTTGGGSGEVVSFAPTSLLVGLSNRLAGKADVLYSRGLYTGPQLARLTRFTTDEAGEHLGVTHETFPNGDLRGAASETSVEQAMTMVGTTRREPEEQEALALHSTLSTSVYDQKLVSYRYTGYYKAETAGEYLAFVQTERPFRMMVDGRVVFDNAVIPKQILNQVHLPMTAGAHKVVLELLGAGRTGGLRFALLVGIWPVKDLVDPETLAVARRADAVVLSVGFNNSSETEGGDRGWELPLGQDELIAAAAALGKKTVVVVNAGGSVDVTPWKDKVGAVMMAWYGGEDGGTAVASLLMGDASPSGHLPISWERRLEDNPSFAYYYPAAGSREIKYGEGIFVGYRGYDHLGRKPLYPFGYGLSYTGFAFSGMTVTEGAPGVETVRFTVRNTGKVAGAAVAQVYVSPQTSGVERPEKELKGFARVALQAGESREVSVRLRPRDFAYFDEGGKDWRVAAGTYRVRVGESSAVLPLEGEVRIGREMRIGVAE